MSLEFLREHTGILLLMRYKVTKIYLREFGIFQLLPPSEFLNKNFFDDPFKIFCYDPFLK